MKKANITVAFDEEKLGALEFSLRKEGSSVRRGWSRPWDGSTSALCPRRCGSTWTAAPAPHPGPAARPSPRPRSGPHRPGRKRRAAYDLPEGCCLAGRAVV